MIYRLRIFPAAASDVVQITAYVTGFNSAAAELFEHELWQSIELLKSNPEIGTLVPQTSPPIRFKRVSGCFRRYLMFYRISDPDTLELVRILHGARETRGILGV